MAEGVDIEDKFRSSFSDTDSDEHEIDEIQGEVQDVIVEADDSVASVERKTELIRETTFGKDNKGRMTEPKTEYVPEIIVEDDDIVDSMEINARSIPNIKVKDDGAVRIADMYSCSVPEITAEDGETRDDLPRLDFSGKTPKLATRNFSEVYAKRTHPAERMSSVPNTGTNPRLKATRSSLSRQGSRVQEGPRLQTEEIFREKTDDFLLSSTRDKEKVQRLKLMIDRSESIIEKHKTKATVLKLNVRSKAFDRAYELLKEKKLVHITGKLGSGKTHTALDVITSLVEEFEHYKPLIIGSPLDLVVLENTASCILVLADELAGSGTHNDSVAIGWRHVMKIIIPLMERKRICFIFTSETANVDAFAQQTDSFHGWIGKQTLVNLDDEDLYFSDREQNKMLTSYCKHFCKPLYTHPREIEDFILAHGYSVGFPLICNLVGIGGSSDLFSDPYNALCAFVSEQHEHHFPSFFLLLLVLITERDCSLLKFQHEDQPTFEKLSDLTNSQKCSHSEVSIGLTRLKRQNILFEEESGDISFTHELIAAAVTSHLFTIYAPQDFIPLLPVKVINTLTMIPEIYFGNSNHNGHPIKSQLESSSEALRGVVANFSNALDSKQPEDFLTVASSQMWSFDSFVNTVFTVLGCQFFFVEDIHKTPLSSYLVRIGNVSVISRLVDYMRSQPRQIVVMTKASIEKTKEMSCRFDEQETLNQLFTLSSDTNVSLVHAAIEGGNVNISKLIMHQNAKESMSVSREMLQRACKYGNFEVMKYLFSKLEMRLDSNVSKLIQMRKQNSEGETLLHYAAHGGNVSVFDFLLEQRCDPSSRTREGNSVLHIAAMFGRLQMVRFICSRFPELLREKNKSDFTCIHLAAREGHADVLQLLVCRESNIKDLVKDENTILHLAAANGHCEIISYALVVDPMQQHATNKKFLLPVDLAVKYGSLDPLKLFLKTGTDIMTRTVDKRTLLHLAAYYGHQDIVRYLCRYKPQLINIVDIEKNTVGHDAAASGNIQVLEYLIDKGVDPLSVNSHNTTLLHEACFNGHLEMARYLCANYPSLLCVVTNNGYTVCFGAAICGNVDILKFLVDNGADPRRASVDGSTVLHEAAFSGKLEVVRYLCTYFPNLKEAENVKTYFACHFAAQEGHLEVLDILLSGKTMPLPTTSENQTLLHIASYNGMMPVVKYLCNKYPGIISCLDKEKSSALHYVARGGYSEILQQLVDLGLDPGSTTNSGSTILHLAAYDGNTDMVTYLCSQYPQLIHNLDSTGYSAAHYAAGSGEVPLLLNILKYGIDPLVRSSNGSTLLLKAAYTGRFEMVKYLCMEYSEIVPITDAFGCNALHYAACGGHFDLIQYLVGQGIDPKSRTNDGHTVLHVAAFHGQKDLVYHICKQYPNLLNLKDMSGKTAEQTAIHHGKTKVINFFQSLKEAEDERENEFVNGMLTDICCCERTNVCGQIMRIFESILCCCRR